MSSLPDKTAPATILVVDDTSANLRLLNELLSGQGYEVRVALDGEMALESIRDAPPDLVLLDVVMPRMDGFAVCDALKAHEGSKDIPIIFISALDETENKVRAFAAGGVDYITKPFRPGEVLARVKTHLDLQRLNRFQREINEELRRRTAQLRVIDRLQSDFIAAAEPVEMYSRMLDALRSMSGSPAGFLAELLTDDDTGPHLRIYGLTFPDGDEWKRHVGDAWQAGGLDLRRLDNLIGRVVTGGEAIISNAPASDPRSGGMPPGHPPIACFIGIPIYCGERLVGEIGLANREGGYDEALLDYLLPLAQTCGQIIVARQERQARITAEQELARLARKDGLTNIANRRTFDEFLRQEWRRLVRSGEPLSLIMIDIDHFKRYNDRYGHQAGDECLVTVAWMLKERLRRPSDLAARYGGEEFACVLSGTPLDGASHVAGAIRGQLGELALPHEASPVSPVITMSIGVASLQPRAGGDPNDLIAAADQCLYEAKQAGRNRVVSRQL